MKGIVFIKRPLPDSWIIKIKWIQWSIMVFVCIISGIALILVAASGSSPDMKPVLVLAVLSGVMLCCGGLMISSVITNLISNWWNKRKQEKQG